MADECLDIRRRDREKNEDGQRQPGLAQRNTLLRMARSSFDSSEFAPWESILAQAGLQVCRSRSATLSTFIESFQQAHHELTGDPPDTLRLAYRTNVADLDEMTYRERLAEMRGADRQRTYTVRAADPEAGQVTIDFVTHGDQGLAGPWAQRAQVGETITFRGPGGAWHPEEGYGHFVFAGDESAAPAIAAGVEKLPHGATADVYLEIADADATFDMPEPDGVHLHWIARDGATHGTALSQAVREAGIPERRTSWFIHGVAEMIKELRRHLFTDHQIDRADVSISGYWRIGMTEDQWQASKREFNAELDAAEGR